MLAGLDDLLGLVEALVVAALRGDRHDPRIVKHLGRVVEPMHARVGAVRALQLAAPLDIRLEDAREVDARVGLQRQQLAGGVAMLGAVLGDADERHW